VNGLTPQQFDELLHQFGNPNLKLPTILIGGTNGKGSTAVHTACLLSKAGKKVGLFTSPHIQHPEERLAIDGKYISSEELARLDQTVRQQLQPVMDVEQLNFFQFWTLLGWEYFLQNEVDLVVLEVGLGGRLDPTNHSSPLVSAITSISLDHTESLGTTCEAILYEKLPIARAGRPLIFSETDETLMILAKSWCQKNRVVFCTPDVNSSFPQAIQAHQKIQRASAMTIAEAMRKMASFGKLNFHPDCFETIYLPARLQKIDSFTIDIAHNDAALSAIVNTMEHGFNLIIAQPANRDWSGGFIQLARSANQIFFPNMHDDYFSPPLKLKTQLNAHAISSAIANSVEAAMLDSKQEPTLICGSARLAGEALKILRVDTRSVPLYS
jgi:dihydrofolate synthase/folylpolyglutamate synthase